MPTNAPFQKRKYKVTIYFREHREAAGLTQPELAERIGTSKTRISMKERGKEGWKDQYLGALAEALGIASPADLLIRNPLNKDAPGDILDGLNPENRAKVEDYAKLLKNAQEMDDKAA